MRVVYVTERMPFGSGESFIIPEVKQLLQDGHEILILPLGKAAPSHGEAIQPLMEFTHVISLLSPVVVLSIIWSCISHPARTARAVWPLRSSSSLKQFCRNLVALLKGIRAATIVRGWRADHVHSHWANYTSTLAMTVGMLTGIPWSFTAHRYDIVANNLLVEKCRRSAFTRYISESGRALAAARTNGEANRASHLVHMGVIIPERTSSLQSTSSRPTFVCPASLVPVKGHRFLIEAAAVLQKRGIYCEVLLVGDGPLRADLRSRITAANLSRAVKLVGHLPHDEVLALYAAKSISGVVLASIDLGKGLHEGIPVCLMEAMSHGVPVIGTRTGGIPELLRGGAGILVQPADSEALADAMQELVERPDLNRQLGSLGRSRIEESFEISAVCKQLEVLFINAASSGRDCAS